MRKTEKYTIPAQAGERVVETRCDLCDSVVDDHRRGEVAEVTVEFKTGTRYGGEADLDYETFDVCSACWGRVKALFPCAPRRSNVSY